MNRAIKRSIVIFTLCTIASGAKITKEQMQQVTEPVRLVCIQKTKVTDASLANMKAGKLDDVKELKCYINCVMELMQILKKGKVNLENVLRNIDTLMPEEMREDTKRAVEVCKDTGTGIKDFCEVAFTMFKCIYRENPNFYFP